MDVIANGYDDVVISGVENLVRNEAGVGVAVSTRRPVVGEEPRDLVSTQGHDTVQQRHIDVLPLPADAAVVERGEDRHRCVHPGHHIGDGHSHLLGAAAKVVALAGNAHEAANGLEHEVITGLLSAWAALAVPRNGAVHEARVDQAQAFVIKSVALEVADLVVLHQHIADRGEFANQLLPLRMTDIQRDGLLAAVGGGIVGGVRLVGAVGCFQPGRAPGAGVIAATRALDLDDLGTKVSKILRAPGTGKHAGKIEYADVRQCPLPLNSDTGIGALGLQTHGLSRS